MPLPPELENAPEETTVVGDVNVFMEYVTSGQAQQDYATLIAKRLKELEDLDVLRLPPPPCC